MVKLILSFFISIVMGFFSLNQVYVALEYALNMRNSAVKEIAASHKYPDSQYGVMALGISAFTPSFTIESKINGFTILQETSTSITVWVDETVTIRWESVSQFGNVDVVVLRKIEGGVVPNSIEWWADLREYLYEYENLPDVFYKYRDLVSWNKKWLPYLMMTPSVVFTATSFNDIPCRPPQVYMPEKAVEWMVKHTYPAGSFMWPVNYSSHFKYFPGDDCVNALSQSLYCGGMKSDDLWYPYSAAWIYVPKFWRYIVDHGWKQIPCKDANPGDVLLFDVNLSGTPEHATLITGTIEQRPLYSSHTSSKLNMPVPLGDNSMWQCYTYVGR